MSAHEPGFQSDDPALDEVFEHFGPVDVDAFIDSQFNYALGGEEELFGSSQQDGSNKIEAECTPTDAMLDAFEFSFGSDTHINLDGAIPLSPEEELPSNRLICSLCRENMEKDDMESFCGISELSTTTGEAQRKLKVCDGGIELKETTTEIRGAIVSEQQLSDISDDVGTCWRVLGPKLEIAASKLQNLDEEYKFNRDKANALLLMWRQKEGSCATVGRLADFLVRIGRKSIAERLLGVSDVLVRSFTTVSQGEVISLTVKGALNAELDSKLLLCEDAQGNQFMLKPCNSNGTGWNPQEIQKNSLFLETVAAAAEEMGKTSEQRRQESLKRISTEVQELRRQLKRIKLDCSDTEPCHMISEPKENTELPKEMLNDGSTPHQDAECLLRSCEEQRTFCQGMYDSLIKLIGEVAQLRDYNFMCIKELCDFTKELKDKEKTFFSKINQLHDMKQQLNLLQVAQLGELEKWSRTQKDHIEGVEKLLSSLLHQGKSQKLLKRRSEPVLSGKSTHAFGRMRSKTDSSKNPKSQSLSELSDDDRKNNISSPVCVQHMYMMDTDKERKK